jgi:hypothetical protein
MNMDGTPISGPRDYVGADIHIHHAGSRRTFGEDFNSDAEEIKQKSRKAQIIRKVLDEKKKKDTETVNMNPKLKTPNLSEAQTATTAFGRGALDSATFGAGKYGRAAADYAIKNVGNLFGLSKGTTWDKEVNQEYEKDKEAKDKHGTAFGAGALAADLAITATGAGGLARLGAKQAIKLGTKNAAQYGSTFAKKLVPGAIETGFAKTGIESTKEKIQQGDYKGAGIEALGTLPIVGTVGRLTAKTPQTLKRWEKADTALNAAGVAPFVPQIPGLVDKTAQVGKMVYDNPEIVGPALKYTAQGFVDAAKNRYFPKKPTE